MWTELTGEQIGRERMRFFERLKAAASAEWRVYTEHPFTNGMANGLLAEAAFRHYLVQDYLFLIEFARAYALAVYKAPKLADIAKLLPAFRPSSMSMNAREALCRLGVCRRIDLERAPPAIETLAYTRYVLDTGMRGDLLALQVALAPCVIGYAEIAARLATRPEAQAETNPYRGCLALARFCASFSICGSSARAAAINRGTSIKARTRFCSSASDNSPRARPAAIARHASALS